MDTSENSHNNKGNLKLLFIIVAGVLIALVVFTVGKSMWDSHQVTNATKNAEMTQVTINGLKSASQSISSQKSMLETNYNKNLAYKKNIGAWMEMWTTSTFKGADYDQFKTNMKNLSSDLQGWVDAMKKYNSSAAESDASLIRSAGLPASYDIKKELNDELSSAFSGIDPKKFTPDLVIPKI